MYKIKESVLKNSVNIEIKKYIQKQKYIQIEVIPIT